ncbi:3-oxoacyl-ACP reductase [Prauserella marina]|uniref:3-oxoacyl-[acyl-carrier protein] reductase n=1 Tax=Prauserella marina TaxID=530584 RepID=A0A222VVQ8_9PSEU|nr:SDR family oxidoreductase [Prauserella marina]ASR38019.1 3-oxoacyl-ACP reductase [Prauserella marina]PWV73253.1 3-oxoacyl-[acyl-carrier protein] reductase [Prauserella marina]SDD68110.1 3-oxoacyl-[acyl-carrier protein] reductase [Prauserella marina]
MRDPEGSTGTSRGVALVTGGSRGLGAAIVRALASDGFAVAINYASSADAATSLRDEIVADGGSAEVFGADVTDEAEVADLHARVVARLGSVDTLVLNATGPQPMIPVAELTWQDLLDQLVFFAKSPVLLVTEVLPGMKERGWGRIIQIGSEVVELGAPNQSAYVAAKGAQLGLTRSWARELGEFGITVNLVAPGWVPTERHDRVPASALRDYAKDVPLGHLGMPADVADAVAFLASERAAFITGQRLAVNGGNTLS